MEAIHTAAAGGNPFEVRDILKTTTDINALTSPNGFTALHMAVATIFEDSARQEVLEILCAAGINKEIRTRDKGLTALQLAAMRNKPLCVKTLIDCGADFKTKEGNGATALHGAAYFGHTEVVKVLLAAGADPVEADFHGNTPISLAQSKGYSEVLDLLLKAKK